MKKILWYPGSNISGLHRRGFALRLRSPRGSGTRLLIASFFCKSSSNILNSCLIKLIWLFLSCCDKMWSWFNISLIFCCCTVRFLWYFLIRCATSQAWESRAECHSYFYKKTDIGSEQKEAKDTRIHHKYYIFLVSSALLSKILFIPCDWLSLYIKLLRNY